MVKPKCFGTTELKDTIICKACTYVKKCKAIKNKDVNWESLERRLYKK